MDSDTKYAGSLMLLLIY